MTQQPATVKPLAIGASRDFYVDGTGLKVCIYRKPTGYRITVIGLDGHAVGCWTREFVDGAGDIPLGMTIRQAANEYRLSLLGDLRTETPAQVTARVTTDRTIAAVEATDTVTATATDAALAAKLPAAQARALLAANGGIIRRGHGISVLTLQALARRHLGQLMHPQDTPRRTVVGLRLNAQGLRLQAALINHTPVLAA